MDSVIYLTCGLIALIALVVIFCVKCCGIVRVKEFTAGKTFKTAVALIAAVVMYFTPDHIDYCIITILSFFGIPPLVIDSIKDKDKDGL